MQFELFVFGKCNFNTYILLCVKKINIFSKISKSIFRCISVYKLKKCTFFAFWICSLQKQYDGIEITLRKSYHIIWNMFVWTAHYAFVMFSLSEIVCFIHSHHQIASENFDSIFQQNNSKIDFVLTLKWYNTLFFLVLTYINFCLFQDEYKMLLTSKMYLHFYFCQLPVKLKE